MKKQKICGLLLGLSLSGAMVYGGATFSRVKTWVSLATLTAADLNAEFNNILTNLTPAGVDDYSSSAGQMQSATDPYPASVESLATSLSGEIERIRYQILQIKKSMQATSATYWYQDLPTQGIFTIAGNDIGINATVPRYSIDAWDRTGGVGTIYVSTTSNSSKGAFLQTLNVYDAILAGGAESNGTYWYARNSVGASNVTVSSSGVSVYSDSSVVDGSTFTPTRRLFVSNAGTTTITGNLSVSGTVSSSGNEFSSSTLRGYVNFSSFSYVHVYFSGVAPTLTDNTEVTVNFDTTGTDTLGEFSLASDSFTAVYAGYYMMEALYQMSGSAAGYRYMFMGRNGNSSPAPGCWIDYRASTTPMPTVNTETCFSQLSAGDTINVRVKPVSIGSNPTGGNSEFTAALTIRRIN